MARSIAWDKNIGRRLQLRELHVFITVAEQRSMAKAATELNVTQPSVSAIIAGLEDTLGVRLFDRRSIGVELTPFGASLLARSRTIFDELRQGLGELREMKGSGGGQIRLGCPESISAGFLPAVIERLLQKDPRIVMLVSSVNTPTLDFVELGERKLDLVIARLATTDLSIIPNEYQVEMLLDDRLCIVAGKHSVWARRKKLSIGDTSEATWIISHPSPGSDWLAQTFKSDNAKFPENYISTYSGHLRNNLLATGRFIATMPLTAFESARDKFGLKMLPIECQQPRWPIAIVTIKGRTLNPAVNRFLGCARDVAKSFNLVRTR